MQEWELGIVRRAFAKQVLAAVGVDNPGLEDAFASVKREDFLGPGPWQIFRWGQAYRQTPSSDPVYLYTDDLVGLIPERRLNNGQPQLHAYLINLASPKPGEHVVHAAAAEHAGRASGDVGDLHGSSLTPWPLAGSPWEARAGRS